MVNFCSVANCLNSSRNRPDLSFFCFPSEQNSRRLWKNFCRRNDPEFRGKKKPRICSAHFEASSIKNSLGGRREIIPGEFNPSTNEGPVSSREKRLDDRKKRTSHEQCPKPKKSRKEGKDTWVATSNEAVLLDHNYCQRLLNNDKGTQTDFPFEDLQVLNSEINTLKEENANLKAKLTNSKQLKCG